MSFSSSERVGAIAAALARAQAELANPEKSLTATILPAKVGEAPRQFRYAPLAAGLELVRKALGKQEIATLQATAIDLSAGFVRLDTRLVHASGEWFGSQWPVCALADLAQPRRMGAALTYARRYALFSLVGVAGEDDLDAPDLELKVEPTRAAPANGAAGPNGAKPPIGPANGRGKGGAPILVAPALPAGPAAALRDRLIGEIDRLSGSDDAAAWAATGLPAKAALPLKDAQAVEARFRDRVGRFEAATEAAGAPAGPRAAAAAPAGETSQPSIATEAAAAALVPPSLDAAVVADADALADADAEAAAPTEPIAPSPAQPGPSSALDPPPDAGAPPSSPDAPPDADAPPSSPDAPRPPASLAASAAGGDPERPGAGEQLLKPPPLAPAGRGPVAKPIRLRDPEHRKFVARQPCVVCGRRPSDPHHLRYLQPRALGRKVSDEFTVPLCRGHHRELHRAGDERRWWGERGLDPEPIALELWRRSREGRRSAGGADRQLPPPPAAPPPAEPSP